MAERLVEDNKLTQQGHLLVRFSIDAAVWHAEIRRVAELNVATLGQLAGDEEMYLVNLGAESLATGGRSVALAVRDDLAPQ